MFQILAINASTFSVVLLNIAYISFRGLETSKVLEVDESVKYVEVFDSESDDVPILKAPEPEDMNQCF